MNSDSGNTAVDWFPDVKVSISLSVRIQKTRIYVEKRRGRAGIFIVIDLFHGL